MIPHTRSSSQLPLRAFRAGSKRCRFAVFPKITLKNGKSPAEQSAPSPRRSAELSSHESRDPSTEGFGLRAAFRLRQHADDGLSAGWPHEHPAAVSELGVEPRNLLFDRRIEPAVWFDRHVLLRLRETGHDGCVLRTWATVQGIAEQERRNQPVAGYMP